MKSKLMLFFFIALFSSCSSVRVVYDYDSTIINEDDYYYYDTFYDTWDAAYFTGEFDTNGDSVFTFYNYDSTLIIPHLPSLNKKLKNWKFLILIKKEF